MVRSQKVQIMQTSLFQLLRAAWAQKNQCGEIKDDSALAEPAEGERPEDYSEAAADVAL